MVDIGGLVRLLLCADAFAQRVQRHCHAPLVKGFGYAQCVLNLHASHKPGTQLSAGVGALTEGAQNSIAGERDKRRTKKRHRGTLPERAVGRLIYRNLLVSHMGLMVYTRRGQESAQSHK